MRNHPNWFLHSAFKFRSHFDIYIYTYSSKLFGCSAIAIVHKLLRIDRRDCLRDFRLRLRDLLENSEDESEGCGRIKGTRREGSNATLLCHELKVLLAESTEHKK